jgi:hypothetical protein
MSRTPSLLLSSLLLSLSALPAAQAAPIAWNTWATSESGTITAPDGTPVDVTFATSNFHQRVANYPTWTPAASYADGSVVDNAPVASNGILQLTGGTAAVNTLSFSTPVIDPVFSIWSLGQPSVPASFVFNGGATPVFVAGGPSAQYGGAAIVVDGNTVSGRESNGTVQFKGTYSELSWTNPLGENWYGFNVGIANAVPEPGMAGLLAAGMATLWLARRRQRRGR